MLLTETICRGCGELIALVPVARLPAAGGELSYRAERVPALAFCSHVDTSRSNELVHVSAREGLNTL